MKVGSKLETKVFLVLYANTRIRVMCTSDARVAFGVAQHGASMTYMLQLCSQVCTICKASAVSSYLRNGSSQDLKVKKNISFAWNYIHFNLESFFICNSSFWKVNCVRRGKRRGGEGRGRKNKERKVFPRLLLVCALCLKRKAFSAQQTQINVFSLLTKLIICCKLWTAKKLVASCVVDSSYLSLLLIRCNCSNLYYFNAFKLFYFTGNRLDTIGFGACFIEENVGWKRKEVRSSNQEIW